MKQVIIYYHNKYRTTNNTTSSLLLIILLILYRTGTCTGSGTGSVCTLEPSMALHYTIITLINTKQQTLQHIITNFISDSHVSAPDLVSLVHDKLKSRTGAGYRTSAGATLYFEPSHIAHKLRCISYILINTIWAANLARTCQYTAIGHGF